jgi:hypothetical protein
LSVDSLTGTLTGRFKLGDATGGGVSSGCNVQRNFTPLNCVSVCHSISSRKILPAQRGGNYEGIATVLRAKHVAVVSNRSFVFCSIRRFYFKLLLLSWKSKGIFTLVNNKRIELELYVDKKARLIYTIIY